jgi:hypothetical protein
VFKADAAKKAAASVGMEYIILTEKSLKVWVHFQKRLKILSRMLEV